MGTVSMAGILVALSLFFIQQPAVAPDLGLLCQVGGGDIVCLLREPQGSEIIGQMEAEFFAEGRP